MAYVSQERKKRIKDQIDAYLKTVKDIKLSYSFSVENHSTLNMNIRSANVDLIHEISKPDNKYVGGRDAENHSYIKDRGYCSLTWKNCVSHMENARLKEVFGKLIEIINCENYDNSDIYTDYFDVGYYSHICVGKWDKPFIVKG